MVGDVCAAQVIPVPAEHIPVLPQHRLGHIDLQGLDWEPMVAVAWLGGAGGLAGAARCGAVGDASGPLVV